MTSWETCCDRQGVDLAMPTRMTKNARFLTAEAPYMTAETTRPDR